MLMPRLLGIRQGLAGAAVVAGLVLLVPLTAGAHSLDSTAISVHVTNDSVDATISLAIPALDEALGTDFVNGDDRDDYAPEIIAYIDGHLVVTSYDDVEWGKSYSNPVRESVEGIESFSVDVDFDIGHSDTSDFTIAYDAIIESIPGHEAVVVLTDANGDISSPGIIGSSGASVEISGASDPVNAIGMIGHGFHHVLQGADHLLFLMTLLLPAPLVVAAGRWRPGRSAIGILRQGGARRNGVHDRSLDDLDRYGAGVDLTTEAAGRGVDRGIGRSLRDPRHPAAGGPWRGDHRRRIRSRSRHGVRRHPHRPGSGGIDVVVGAVRIQRGY